MADLYWWLGGAALIAVVALVSRLTREPSPHPLTDEHIRQAVRAGDAVKAVRYHRELHGSTLPAAKAAIDQLIAEGKS